MQAKNLEFVIDQITQNDAPFAVACRAALEVGILVPSLLRSSLESAGFRVLDDKKLKEHGIPPMKHLHRAAVFDGDDMIAFGAAGTTDEALLHAVLGWCRENKVGDKPAPKGLVSKPA